jgi:hypothetical protein
MRTATPTIKGEIEMIDKMPAVLPIAILLGAISAAPAFAQTHNHDAMELRSQIMVSPSVKGSDAYGSVISGSYTAQPTQNRRQSLGEAIDLPWIQDPASPRG